MSESLIFSSQNKSEGIAYNTEQLADLNSVSINAIERHKITLQQLRAIFRCDPLPTVKGNSRDLEELFSLVIDLVLKSRTENGKLFIYIRSEETAGDRTRQSSDGIHYYTISVYTNACYDICREEKFITMLKQCENICTANNGSFNYHPVSYTSCLFTINLQGK
jgi:hypothetical protein